MTEETKAYLRYHDVHWCWNCRGAGMTGPLDDPDPCGDCWGYGHFPPWDELDDSAKQRWLKEAKELRARIGV